MSVPAGWYDDGSGRQRWWDGEQWTDHFAPETPDLPDEGGTVLAGSESTADAGHDAGAPADPYAPPVAPGAQDDAQPTQAYPSAASDGYPQSAYGQDASAQAPYGQAPYGQNPYGQAPYGQAGYPGAAAYDPQNPYAAPAPYGGDTAYGAYAAPAPGPRRTPVLGYIGLGLAVVGGIIACVPNFVTFGIGSFLLFAAFVVSIIALFIKNTVKWPGIVGLVLSVVMGIVATVVLSVTLFATYSDRAWDSGYDPYASEEPWPDESTAPDATGPDATGERPSAEELATGLETIVDETGAGSYPDDLLLCLGDVFYGSDMSDEALQTVAEGSTDFADPTDGLDFASTFADAAGTCSQ
ncbi:DUF2510 domain-containing protein [Microbacterium sp. NPDC089318]